MNMCMKKKTKNQQVTVTHFTTLEKSVSLTFKQVACTSQFPAYRQKDVFAGNVWACIKLGLIQGLCSLHSWVGPISSRFNMEGNSMLHFFRGV